MLAGVRLPIVLLLPVFTWLPILAMPLPGEVAPTPREDEPADAAESDVVGNTGDARWSIPIGVPHAW